MAQGQAVEKLKPQEQALMQVAQELGVVRYAEGGGMMIDLTNPKLREKYNVLAPAATIIKSDPNFTPSLSEIHLDPDWENGGDFYPQDTSGSGQNKTVKTLSLAKKALDQIGQAAGIEDLGPEIKYTGDRGQNVLVTWHARIRNRDGWTYRPLIGSQEWNEEAEMALLKADPPEWAQKGESAYNQWWAKNWWGRVHKSRVRMTETKARLAAYRQALTVKQKYLPAETKKPFLVVSLTYTPDTSNPAVLGMLMQQGQQAAGLLYGAGTPQAESVIDVEAREEETPFDPKTGEVLERQAPAEAKATAPAEPSGETHGERPSDDRIIPGGKHKDRLLSEVCKEDPDYAREHFLNAAPPLGPLTDEWLAFHGEVKDDFADCTF